MRPISARSSDRADAGHDADPQRHKAEDEQADAPFLAVARRRRPQTKRRHRRSLTTFSASLANQRSEARCPSGRLAATPSTLNEFRLGQSPRLAAARSPPASPSGATARRRRARQGRRRARNRQAQKREQRPVEAVNRAGPERDVGAPRALVGAQGLRAADVAPFRARFDRAGDDRLDVAQAELSPCAPIGGRTCAASPTSASRSAAIFGTIWRTIGKNPRSPSMRIAPRSECACARSPAQALRRRAPRAGALLRRHHPDEARAVGRRRARRQRNEGERPAAGVELGREVVVRQPMGEMRGQCGLRIAMDARFEPAARRALNRGRRRRWQAAPRSRARLRASPGRRRRRTRMPRPRPRCARRRAFRATWPRAPRPSGRSRYSSRRRRARSPRRGTRPAAAETCPVSSMRRNPRNGAARARDPVHIPRDLR